MGKSVVDGLLEGESRPLSQLHSALFRGRVKILNPRVVDFSDRGIDMFLENDDVGVRDFLRVRRREKWGAALMDRIYIDHRRSDREQRQKSESSETPHDGRRTGVEKKKERTE